MMPMPYVLRFHTTTTSEIRILTRNRRIDPSRMILRTVYGRRWSIRGVRNCLAGQNSWRREQLTRMHVCKNNENVNLTSTKVHLFNLDQCFPTFGCWRPTKHKNTQFGDPYFIIIVLATQNYVAETEKWVKTHLFSHTVLDHSSLI